MPETEGALEGLKEQLKLYQELLELTKQEHNLLQEGQDTSEIKEEQREIRDEIKKLDIEHDLDQSDKLELIKENDSEKLNKFEPVLRELYELEKENQALAN